MYLPNRHIGFISLAALVLASGCEEEQHVRPSSSLPIKTREVIGKTTQQVRAAAPELQGGGARVAAGKVTAKDPVMLSGQVYQVATNSYSAGLVKHALDLYQAEHGEYPKTYREFEDEILKPNQPDGIRLPRLSYYQEYGYDEKEHKLIVLEYPAKKAQFQEQQDQDLGRP
jgi:hypothetical protein